MLSHKPGDWLPLEQLVGGPRSREDVEETCRELARLGVVAMEDRSNGQVVIRLSDWDSESPFGRAGS